MIWLFSLFVACQDQTTQKEASSSEQTAEKSPKKPAVDNPSKIQDFGEPFKIKDVTPAKTFFSAPDSYVGKQIRLEGKVKDVCQKMGCWMVVSDGESSIRVTTKAHKILVAKDGAGSKCHIEGEVISRTKDPERTAHFESESTKGAPIPEKEAKGDTVYEIVATSVRFIKE